MKGDVIDVQGPMLAVADHSLETFHSAEVALIPVEAIGQIAFERPAVGRAMWSETLVDAAISREWILNVGRHDAKTRAAHFLCELSVRVERAGLGERCNYQLPMTQEQLADCLGLTSVHTNRVLMRLGEEGLITRTHRSVRVDDWSKLARAGEFDAAYLHLPSA
jgi:CRP-like cAMP-binding protein